MGKTPAQKRWLLKGHNYIEWAKATKVPRIKMWAWDAININLPLRYKVDVCFVCNSVIGSEHFLWDCPVLFRVNALKHMFWAINWILFDRCDVGLRWSEIKHIFSEILLKVNDGVDSFFSITNAVGVSH